jgi:hypothetical protein
LKNVVKNSGSITLLPYLALYKKKPPRAGMKKSEEANKGDGCYNVPHGSPVKNNKSRVILIFSILYCR